MGIIDQILHDVPSLVLSTVVAFSTVAYSWVTYLSLQEMRETRRLQSEPNLVLMSSQTIVTIGLSETDDDFLSFEIIDRPYSPKADITLSTDAAPYRLLMNENDLPSLMIKNVGREAALSVEIEWSRPHSRFKELVSKHPYYLKREARIENGILHYKRGMIMLGNLKPTKLPVCIATPQTPHIDEVRIPLLHLLELLGEIFFINVEELDNEFKSTATIKCLDTNGKKHEFRYDVAFTMVTARSKSKESLLGEGGEMDFYFNCVPSTREALAI